MANTIYQPTFLQPELTSVDMAQNQDFTCIVDGTTIDSYRLIIYNNDTSAVLYDTTKTALGSPLFNGETLSVTVTGGTVANGLELKWTMEYWNGSESVLSYETLFSSSTTATLSIAIPVPVTAQAHEFVGTYTQAEGVALQEWYYILYDSDGVEIDRSSVSFSGDIRHTFSGFLNGSSLKIKGFLKTQQNEEIESPLYSFTVSYSVPILDIIPSATVQSDTTSVLTEWGGISQVNGTVTGGSSSYIENFLYTGNWGLELGTGAILSYELDIPITKTFHHVWVQENASFTGEILKLSNTGNSDYHLIGYDTGKFFAEINGVKKYGTLSFRTDRVYIIVIRGTDTLIREYYLSETHGYISDNYTYEEMIVFTHDELETIGS